MLGPCSKWETRVSLWAPETKQGIDFPARITARDDGTCFLIKVKENMTWESIPGRQMTGFRPFCDHSWWHRTVWWAGGSWCPGQNWSWPLGRVRPRRSCRWRTPFCSWSGFGPWPTRSQVWSIAQFYSVDFLHSRISVSKCVFSKRTIKVCVSIF